MCHNINVIYLTTLVCERIKSAFSFNSRRRRKVDTRRRNNLKLVIMCNVRGQIYGQPNLSDQGSPFSSS